MLKKHGWIAALFVAVAMVFMACPPPDEGGSGEWDRNDEFYWLLSDELDEVDAEDFTNTEDAKDVLNPIGISIAGEIPSHLNVAITADKGIKIKTTATWGAGIDLMNEFFMFQAGDTITVNGKLLSGTPTGIYVTMTAGKGETHSALAIGGDNTFTGTWVLTAADITNIRSKPDDDAQRAIRILAKPGNVEFEITEIEFISVGYDPEGFFEVEEIAGVPTEGFVGIAIDLNDEASILPNLAAVNRTIVWSKKTGDEGSATYTLVDGVIEASTAGTAKIVATVVGGLEDGDYTENFTITFAAPAATVEITVAGTAQQITPVAAGLAAFDILPEGNGYVFDNGTADHDGGWVKFTVDLGSKKLVNFVSITLTTTITGADGGWKNVGLLAANKTTGLGTPSSSSNPLSGALLVTNTPGTGAAAGTSVNLTLTIDATKVAGLTESELEVALYARASAGTFFEFKDIVFVEGFADTICGVFPCACTFDKNDSDTHTYGTAHTGGGTIDSTFYGLITAAKDAGKGHGYVIVNIINNGTNLGASNGVGQFGGSVTNLNTTKAVGAGETDAIKVPLSQITSNALNIWLNCAIVSYELWLPEAP